MIESLYEWRGVLFALVIVAAIIDIRSFTIPNVLPVLAIGLLPVILLARRYGRRRWKAVCSGRSLVWPWRDDQSRILDRSLWRFRIADIAVDPNGVAAIDARRRERRQLQHHENACSLWRRDRRRRDNCGPGAAGDLNRAE